MSKIIQLLLLPSQEVIKSEAAKMSRAQNIAIKGMKTSIFEKASGYQLHRLYAAKARSWPDQLTVKGWVSNMSR